MRLTRYPHPTLSNSRRRAATRPPASPGTRPARLARSRVRRTTNRVAACSSTTPDRDHRTPESGTRRFEKRRQHRAWLVLELVALGLLLSVSAHAETVQVFALARSVDDVLGNIRNWIMGILAGVAVVFLTIGGLRYLMASGEPGEIEKAKGAFKAAGIGFGLAALAPLVVEILKNIVGGV